jgi:D-serine dehydratase
MTALNTGPLALDRLADTLHEPGVKGLPITAPLRQRDIGAQGWNLLHGDVSFPAAVLKHSALEHNLAWMRAFCERFGAQLAPHGKTTMSPQLWAAQLANGAWGITLANAAQVQVAYRFGVRRVLLANQLVARTDIAALRQLMENDPAFELVALVDSSAGVARLAQGFAGSSVRLPLLVELGMAGKRAGCRSVAQALALAREVAQAGALQLAGIEGYEGLLTTHDRAADVVAVRAFVADLVAIVRGADAEGLFTGAQIILSGGGSAYFDLVARGFAELGPMSRPVLPVLRSGCYLTSDHGSYHRLLAEMDARESGLPAGRLQPALEVWSMVQSRPEPTLAILSMGKRDASYDVDLPIPLVAHTPGPGTPRALPPGCSIEKMNDQHGYLRLPADYALQVGELVACGISHPCTTFDKWPLLLAVDDDYRVCYGINTFF